MRDKSDFRRFYRDFLFSTRTRNPKTFPSPVAPRFVSVERRFMEANWEFSDEVHFLRMFRAILLSINSDTEGAHLRPENIAKAIEGIRTRMAHRHGWESVEHVALLREITRILLQPLTDFEDRYPISEAIAACLPRIDARLSQLREQGPQHTELSPPELSQIDLKKMMAETMEFHRLRFDWVAFELNVKLDKLVHLDTGRFDSALNHLLLNSEASLDRRIKMHPGPAEIRITAAKARKGADEFLELVVQDNGIGMTDAEQAKALRGSGREHGLQSVMRIARFYDGYVRVNSTYGQGARVAMGWNMALIPETDLAQAAKDAQRRRL